MISKLKTTGKLEESSFVALVGNLHQQRMTGSLHLTDTRLGRPVERVIYLSTGEVYAAASNLAVDSALAILVRGGRVTPEQSQQIQVEVIGGRSFSEALVAHGCVSAAELNHLRVEHVKSIFDSLCEWASGEYRFVEAAAVTGGNLGITTKEMILGGVLQAQIPNSFETMFTDSRTWISTEHSPLTEINFQPFTQFVLSCLNQPRNLSILIESGRLGESIREINQQLYGLHCIGLIDFTTALAPAENPLLVHTTTKAAMMAAGFGKTIEPENVSQDASMALTFPLQEDPESANRRKLSEVKREIKEMRRTLALAEDDYAVLGLQSGATTTDVKHAYRILVNNYHPDRYHQFADTVTLNTLSDMLMAIRASYETAIEHALLNEIISNNTKRYKPSNGQRPVFSARVKTSIERIPFDEFRQEDNQHRQESLADGKHRQSLAHQIRGEYDAALSSLTDAVTLAPNSARYHGELALLLEKNPFRRDQAEQHFLRATELEPGNLFYHLQLGNYYRGLGKLVRAEQQFTMALKIDAQDRAAQIALEEVVSLRKASMKTVHSTNYARRATPKRQGFWSRIFSRAANLL
jgi:tetratricopeptide (TPR) repeat protein